MTVQLALSSALVLFTVAMHGFGLLVLSRLLRIEAQEERQHHLTPASLRGLMMTFALVFGLFALHGLEIWLYALVYLLLGAVPDLETAVYFSTITYSTIGYNDDAMQSSWRLVSAIEGINGVMLMGWSTAFFISIIGRLRSN